MKKWKRYRSLRRLVVTFAAVAVAVPVAQVQAQATQQDPGFTQPATAQTAKRIYGIPADSYRRLPADDQEALRPPRSVATEASSPSAATGAYSPSTPGKTAPVRTSTPVVVFDSSNTSSWGDAGIWAASGLLLISFGALGRVLLARRSRIGQPAV
jgi:cytoskeletal protein RodZ